MLQSVPRLLALANALAAGQKASAPSASFPKGVNFGGWLNLEDWFFSGDAGTQVSTPSAMSQGQGACLPPLVAQLPRHWSSEGMLVKLLNDTMGPEKTAEAFMAYRHSYIGNRDLAEVAALGIESIRVPINWGAFADALKSLDNSIYGSHDPDEHTVLVPDPFYSSSRALVTVPRGWLRNFLRRCASLNLKVLLDLHAFPGGSSDGTYNSVWPQPPKFWTESAQIGHSKMSLQEAGQLVVQGLIDWVASLPDGERRVVKGLTLMNEPAHLSAWANWTTEQRVLDWLTEAGNRFRRSPLPSAGTRLYMNMIETAFKDFYATVPKWWNSAFSETEQGQWAVMDIHWYSAWSGGSCSGRLVPGGAYYCDDTLEQIQNVTSRCVNGYVQNVRQHFKGLHAISEFSLGTNSEALSACTDATTTGLFLQAQVEAFEKAAIEPFFWTWRMPYGTNFEAGWSLKHVAGLEVQQRKLPCRQPLSAEADLSIVASEDTSGEANFVYA